MINRFLCILFAMALFCVCGCQTTQPKTQPDSTSQAVSALGTVTEGLTNQSVSQKDLRNLAVQVQKDSQVKSAVQSINEALKATGGCVKYCPTDGERFDCSVMKCPKHNVELKIVE